MIEVENLTKRYGDRAAIDGVSFRVEKGEIMGFLGPNGAGKTTTMRILAGVMGATTGTVRVGSFDINTDPVEAKKRIGYLPEIPPVYVDMTVKAYVDFSARLHGVPSAKRKAAVDKALERMNLGEVRDRLIGHLSKGFQQRVGLAQALVHEPDVLILDEPTVGLDPSQIIDIRGLIRGLAGQHTIILSTHILPEVEMTCTQVVVINRGRVVRQGSMADLRLELSGQDALEARIAREDGGLAAALQAVPGVLAVTTPSPTELKLNTEKGVDVREHVAKVIVDRGVGLLELKRQTTSLEEIFVQLTTHEEVGP